MDAADWDKRYSDSELVWGAPPNRYVVQHTAALPPGRALDLACGEGRNALWLGTRAWEVTATDFSAVALRKAAEVAATAPRSVVARLGWQQADATELDSDPVYDLVLMVYLHLPAEQRRAVLARACAATVPGGRLLVVGHDSINLTEGYGGPPDPALLFTPDDIVAELPPGMSTLTAERANREVNTPDGVRTAIDAVVVAAR